MNSTIQDDPAFFDHRLLIEILSWDLTLSLRVVSDTTPREACFDEGLVRTRSIELRGRVLAPIAERGRPITIALSPFGAELSSAETGEPWKSVGRLLWDEGAEMWARLSIPEGDVAPALTALAHVWRYLHLFTFDEDDEGAPVRSYAFNSKLHRNISAWIEARI